MKWMYIYHYMNVNRAGGPRDDLNVNKPKDANPTALKANGLAPQLIAGTSQPQTSGNWFTRIVKLITSSSSSKAAVVKTAKKITETGRDLKAQKEIFGKLAEVNKELDHKRKLLRASEKKFSEFRTKPPKTPEDRELLEKIKRTLPIQQKLISALETKREQLREELGTINKKYLDP